MSANSPVEDADLVMPSNAFNMVARRAIMRYVGTTTVQNTVATWSVLTTGSAVNFVKLFATTKLRIDMSAECIQTVTPSTIDFGIRIQKTGSTVTTDVHVVRISHKVISEVACYGGVLISTSPADTGVYKLQPIWRNVGAAGTAEFRAGYVLSFSAREVLAT